MPMPGGTDRPALKTRRQENYKWVSGSIACLLVCCVPNERTTQERDKATQLPLLKFSPDFPDENPKEEV